MDDIVGPIKTYLAKADPSKIDNFVFKLHVRLTFALMLACMALVSQVHFRWNYFIFLSNRLDKFHLHIIIQLFIFGIIFFIRWEQDNILEAQLAAWEMEYQEAQWIYIVGFTQRFQFHQGNKYIKLIYLILFINQQHIILHQILNNHCTT